MYGGTVAVVYAYDADGNDIFSKVDWSITDEEGQEPSEVYIRNKGVWVDPDAKPGYYTLKGTGRDGRALGDAYTTSLQGLVILLLSGCKQKAVLEKGEKAE